MKKRRTICWVSARNRRGFDAASKIAQEGLRTFARNSDPQKVAQELVGEANMSAAEMVRELLL